MNPGVLCAITAANVCVSRWLTAKEQRRAAGGTVTRKRQLEPCSVLHSSSSAPTAHARAHRVCEGVNLAPVRTHFSKQHPLHKVVYWNEPRHFTFFFSFFFPHPFRLHLCLSGAVFRSHWPQGAWCVITAWPLAAPFLIPAPPSQRLTALLLAITCTHVHRSLATVALSYGACQGFGDCQNSPNLFPVDSLSASVIVPFLTLSQVKPKLLLSVNKIHFILDLLNF